MAFENTINQKALRFEMELKQGDTLSTLLFNISLETVMMLRHPDTIQPQNLIICLNQELI